MAVSTTRGILKGNGPGPHQVKTFKVSRDPRFEIRVRDVVLSVDEKTRRQAPGRAQRPLPMTSTLRHCCSRRGT